MPDRDLLARAPDVELAPQATGRLLKWPSFQPAQMARFSPGADTPRAIRSPLAGLIATSSPLLPSKASERVGCPDETIALDDQEARKVRLLLLGKGVVSAPRIERPFAARLDDKQQRPTAMRFPATRRFVDEVLPVINDHWGASGTDLNGQAAQLRGGGTATVTEPTR
jgi:hypothetical protein